MVEVADLSCLVDYPCNDMVIDGQGRAYIGNMGYDFSDDQATPQQCPILRVTPNCTARIVAEGLTL